MRDHDQETIVKLIHESFEDVVYPGDDQLFEDVYDPDIPAFSKILRGKHWKETLGILANFELEEFLFHSSMFSFMTPEALHYFTPAFLIIPIEHQSDLFGDNFGSKLMPDDSEWSQQRFSQLTSLFSARQKHAIAVALDYLHGEHKEFYRQTRNHHILQYLEYWSQWLEA
jgi:hypothetical protein